MPTIGNVGEKYALIAMDMSVSSTSYGIAQLNDELWVVINCPPITFPDHWQQWIGSVRVDNMRNTNLTLLTKLPSPNPTILDQENEDLKRKVERYYYGLLLTGRMVSRGTPLLLTGAHNGQEVDVRQQSDLKVLPQFVGMPPDLVTPMHMDKAAALGKGLGEMEARGKFQRFFRVLKIYAGARSMTDALDQIHQFCRCIEGLIVPEVGQTARQFKSRTELFIGPGHHDLMGSLFDFRSAVEHLNVHLYVRRDRAQRVDLLRSVAIAEGIARHCIAHIISEPTLWPHFENDNALASFWHLRFSDRASLWGDPIDPNASVGNFRPDDISDQQLGI